MGRPSSDDKKGVARKRCPRCGEMTLDAIPEMNALSRRDNATHICSACSTREALDDMLAAKYGFTFAELTVLKRLANAVWAQVGGDVLTCMGSDSVSRDVVWEAVTDAGRMQWPQLIRDLARYDLAGKVLGEAGIFALVKRFESRIRASEPELAKYFFPFARYGY